MRREVSQLRDELKQKDELLVVYNQNNAQLQNDLQGLRQSMSEVKQSHEVVVSPTRVVEEVVVSVPTATEVMMDRLIERQTEVNEQPSTVVEIASEEPLRASQIEEQQTELQSSSPAEVPVVESSSADTSVVQSPTDPSAETTKPTDEIGVTRDEVKQDQPDLIEATATSELTENGSRAQHRSDDEKDNSEGSVSESESSEESMSSESEENPKELRASNSSSVASSSTGAASKFNTNPAKAEPKQPPVKVQATITKNSSRKGPSKLCGVLILILWLLVSSIALFMVKPELVSSFIDIPASSEILSTVYSTVYNYVKSYL